MKNSQDEKVINFHRLLMVDSSNPNHNVLIREYWIFAT